MRIDPSKYEIINHTTLTPRMFEEFAIRHTFRQRYWLTVVVPAIILAVGLYLVTVSLGVGIAVSALALLLPLLLYVRAKSIGKRQYGAMFNVPNPNNEATYYFDREGFSIDMPRAKPRTYHYEWKDVIHLASSKSCIYIYTSSQKIYMVDKHTFIKGDSYALLTLLRSL